MPEKIFQQRPKNACKIALPDSPHRHGGGGGTTEKNNSDFPSSSAHGSAYNIQENVWRLRLCARNRVHTRYSHKGDGGLGTYRPQRVWKKLHNRFSCAKGTNIRLYAYVKVLRLVNCECD